MLKPDETTIGLKKTTARKLKESCKKTETYDTKINKLLDGQDPPSVVKCPCCGEKLRISSVTIKPCIVVKNGRRIEEPRIAEATLKPAKKK